MFVFLGARFPLLQLYPEEIIKDVFTKLFRLKYLFIKFYTCSQKKEKNKMVNFYF